MLELKRLFLITFIFIHVTFEQFKIKLYLVEYTKRCPDNLVKIKNLIKIGHIILKNRSFICSL